MIKEKFFYWDGKEILKLPMLMENETEKNSADR